HPDGPAPRFGSCYFLLSPKVSSRSTYTYLDSHTSGKFLLKPFLHPYP
ncbi:DUF3626 domain-containing protein, partial [Escherichia sp. TWPC-MK]